MFEIGIKNFRNFTHLKTLKFKDINILTGLNNSGKSTIVKLLVLLQDAFFRADIPDLKFITGKYNLGNFKANLNIFQKEENHFSVILKFSEPELFAIEYQFQKKKNDEERAEIKELRLWLYNDKPFLILRNNSDNYIEITEDDKEYFQKKDIGYKITHTLHLCPYQILFYILNELEEIAQKEDINEYIKNIYNQHIEDIKNEYNLQSDELELKLKDHIEDLFNTIENEENEIEDRYENKIEEIKNNNNFTETEKEEKVLKLNYEKKEALSILDKKKRKQEKEIQAEYDNEKNELLSRMNEKIAKQEQLKNDFTPILHERYPKALNQNISIKELKNKNISLDDYVFSKLDFNKDTFSFFDLIEEPIKRKVRNEEDEHEDESLVQHISEKFKNYFKKEEEYIQSIENLKEKEDNQRDSKLKYESPITFALHKIFEQVIDALILFKNKDFYHVRSVLDLTSRYIPETNANQFLSEFYRLRNSQSEKYKKIKKEILELLQIFDFDKNLDFDIDRVENSGYKIEIQNSGEKINIADWGDGTKHIFSILLQIITNSRLDGKRKASVFIVEEPEVHLHPKTQSLLADLFVELSKKGIRLIIETHSEYLIRKLQILVADKKTKAENISIHYFDDEMREIKISEDGQLSADFGEGFFDESANQITNLWKTQRK